MESLKHILFSILILISFSNPSSCESLDTLIHDYVNNKISFNQTTIPRTGVIRNLTFNSSAIKLSVVRLRSGSLWARGQNISSFQMPPMIIPTPFIKRLVLVTSNLGNLSSNYFTPPQGYVFASPVVGLAIYNASTSTFLSNTSIDISMTGGPIVVTFPNLVGNNDSMCIGFGKDGVGGKAVGMVSTSGQCSVYNKGYFAIVVRDTTQGRRSSNTRWLVGVVIGVALVGVLIMCCVGVCIWRIVERKKIKEMERQSEKEVGVGTMWIGNSRLPTGNMCRTQPQLESEMLP